MNLDGKNRCSWVGNKPHLIAYHDGEWGIPVHDDTKHFEMLVLEGAQAGLSWETVLLKRENYRQVFAGFNPEKVAGFDEEKIQQILQNPGIIRNKLKVRGAVKNARVFLEIQSDFASFDNYVWGFVGGKPIINYWQKIEDIPTATPESHALAKDLKKRGMTFVGSTIIYAYMQAVGLVDDHTLDCFVRTEGR